MPFHVPFMAIKAALFLLVLGLAGLLAWRVPARCAGWRSLPTLLLCLAASLCLALTVPQAIAPGTAARLSQCLADPGAGLAYSVRIFGTRGLEDLMNVALWVPVGFFGVLATCRPVYAVGGISLAMLVVELLQTVDPGRECDPGDWAYNTAGGLVGAVLAWALLRVYAWLRGRRLRPASAIQDGTVR